MARRVSRFTALVAAPLGAIAAVVVAGAPSPASAQSSLLLSVTATVGNACRIQSDVTGIAFGSLSANTAAESNAATLTVFCDIADTLVTLHVDDGEHSADGGASGRKLKSDTATTPVYIPYDACQGDPGNGCTAPPTGPFLADSDGATQKIHARIAAQSFTQQDTYSDALGIEITF